MSLASYIKDLKKHVNHYPLGIGCHKLLTIEKDEVLDKIITSRLIRIMKGGIPYLKFVTFKGKLVINTEEHFQELDRRFGK